VGPENERDEYERIFLFRKDEALDKFKIYFPRRLLQVFDKLSLLSSSYADSTEMAKAQEAFWKQSGLDK